MDFTAHVWFLVSSNGWVYIPVTFHNARFRVLEKFQFEARQLNQGYSLFPCRNNKMILLKRFYDGAKNDLHFVNTKTD
jgi:hypothetical protein